MAVIDMAPVREPWLCLEAGPAIAPLWTEPIAAVHGRPRTRPDSEADLLALAEPVAKAGTASEDADIADDLDHFRSF